MGAGLFLLKVGIYRHNYAVKQITVSHYKYLPLGPETGGRNSLRNVCIHLYDMV